MDEQGASHRFSFAMQQVIALEHVAHGLHAISRGNWMPTGSAAAWSVEEFENLTTEERWTKVLRSMCYAHRRIVSAGVHNKDSQKRFVLSILDKLQATTPVLHGLESEVRSAMIAALDNCLLVRFNAKWSTQCVEFVSSYPTLPESDVLDARQPGSNIPGEHMTLDVTFYEPDVTVATPRWQIEQRLRKAAASLIRLTAHHRKSAVTAPIRMVDHLAQVVVSLPPK